MNWLTELLDRLLSWLPRPKLLDPSEAGLRLSHGKRKKLEGGRLYWYVPLFQKIETFPVVEQTSDLPPQVLLTQNKKPILASGILAYEVRDVEIVLTRTHDIDDIVLDIGRAAVAEVVTGETLQSLMEGLQEGDLTRALTRRARSRLRRYGIHVLRASLNELCPCTVIRTVGAPGQTIVPHPNREDS